MARKYKASVFKLDRLSPELQRKISGSEIYSAPRVTSILDHGPTWDADDPLGMSLSEPATTRMPEILNTGENVTAYVTEGDIFFHVSTSYTSYLQLSIHLPDDSAPQGLKQTCIRLTRETCRKLALVKIDNSLYADLPWKIAPPRTSDRHFTLSIHYDPDNFFSENLFPESPSQSLLQLQKTLTSTSRLTIVVEAATDFYFRKDLDSLIAKFRIGESNSPLRALNAFLRNEAPAPASNQVEPARASFFSWDDYSVTLGVGTKIAREAKENAEREDFECAMHIIGAEKGDRGRYFAIFQVPRDQGQLAGFSPGDKAKVKFKEAGQATEGHSWDMHVIEPIPWSGAGVVTGCLEAGADIESPRRLRVTPVPRDHFGFGFKTVLAGPGLKATVSPESRHSEFPYIMDAFNKLRIEMRFTNPPPNDVRSVPIPCGQQAWQHSEERHLWVTSEQRSRC
jgi:hypothetical protein